MANERTGTVTPNLSDATIMSSLNESHPWIAGTALSPALWMGYDANIDTAPIASAATGGQPSFLDFDSLFDGNLPYVEGMI